jgi:hypothetical protein
MGARTIHLDPGEDYDYLGLYLTACGVKVALDGEEAPEYAVSEDPFAVSCGNCKRSRAYRAALAEEAEFASEASLCAARDPGAV